MNPITILFAFAAGLISVVNPCSIVIIPSFVAFTTAKSVGVKKGLTLSVSYGMGFILLFSLIGSAAIFIPGFLSKQAWFKIVAGVIMMVLGLYILYPFVKSRFKSTVAENENQLEKIQKLQVDRIELPDTKDWSSKSSAFLLGVSHGAYGLGCTGPILASVITAIATETVIEGWFLLSLYGIGMIIPFILLGMFLGKINEIVYSKLIRISKILKLVFGLVILFLGVYYFTDSLKILSLFI